MKRASTKPENAKQAVSKLVQIEKPIYGGAFLARMEGKATFVPLTLPGEQARVRIVEEKRGYVLAEAEEIVTTAPERVVPGCHHFGVCGDVTINTPITNRNSDSSRQFCARRLSAEA